MKSLLVAFAIVGALLVTIAASPPDRARSGALEAPVPTQTVAAWPTTYVADGELAHRRFVIKPSVIDTRRYSFFDETQIRGTGLRWRRWGTDRATARGRVRFCVSDYVPCATKTGTVTLSSRARTRCSSGPTRQRFTYTRLSFAWPDKTLAKRLPVCPTR